MKRILPLLLFLCSVNYLSAQCNGGNICDCVDSTTGVLSGTVTITGGTGGNPNVVTLPLSCNGVPVLLGAVTITVNTNATLVIPDGIGIDATAIDFMVTGSGNATAQLQDGGGSTTYSANGNNEGVGTFGQLNAIIQQEARILPVELTNWEVVATEKGDVRLSWSSAFEEDNAFYFILHSTDGVTFTEMDRVAVAGNTAGDYEYLHENAGSGAHYYRLGQQDLDGTRVTFDVRLANVTYQGRFELPFPNPATAGAFVRLELAADDASTELQLISLVGRTVARFPVDPAQPLQQFQLPEELPAGIYLLRSEGRTSRLLVR